MKILMAILISVLAVTGVIDNIATVNRLKKEAEQAYKEKDYATAINRYHILLDSLNVESENIRMNLAHAYLMSGDTTAAQQNYGRMISSDNPQIKSLAYQQLGVISSNKKQYKEALSLFKESLKANPANNESRYDYELVKKLLREQQQQQQNQKQDQNQEQQGEDQQQKDQQQQNQQGEDQQQQQNQEGEQSEQGEQEQKSDEQGQEGEENPEQPSEKNAQQGQEQQEGEKSDEDQSVSPIAEKLKEMNISEEKAQMILDAMRNNEMQYIQQNRRKPTQARDRSKPDW